MRRTPILALVSMAASSVFALTGTVKDAKGTALSGVALTLVTDPSKKTTSSATGTFDLTVSTSVERNHRTGVRFDRLETQGNRLRLSYAAETEPGLASLVSANGQRLAVTNGLSQDRTLGPALRAAAVIDTLVATKAGYVTSKTAISSYDQTGLALVMTSTADTGSPLPPITDYTLNGPYNTVVEANVGPSGKYTVIRPEPMGANGFLHAPIVYGPGISTPVSSSTNFLKIIASHGFVVVGCNMLTGGPNDAGNNTTMRNGIKWIVEQNTTAGSKYFGKIATTKGVSMGYSVGGTAAVDIGDEPSLATVVSIHGHISKTKLHGPLLQTSGTKDNVGLPMQQQTYTNSTVQTFLGTVTNADHGYIMQNNGGVQRPAIVAWLRYWIYNDQGGKKYFYGADCVMCKSPWENPQRKNWP